MTEHDLTLVGLTEDRQRLVLVSDAGEEFTLPADARLRAALRGEHARLGQLEITMESSLRPRDIQARIRSGETPEHVAAAAGTTVDKVIGYAIPVLAERAHIAERAQRASVRRSAGTGPAGVLADAVAERLRSRGVDPGAVEWDAWRREDGRWVVVADYRSGESARHAEFSFDLPGRYVMAEDDEARWLVGEQTSVKGPQPRSTPGPRRLSSVGLEESELPLGEDALVLVSDPADWMATQASPRGEDTTGHDADTEPTVPVQLSVPPSSGRVDPVELGSEADEPDLATEGGSDPAQAQDEEQDEASSGTQDAARDQAASRPSRKGKRPSVPSWDEIMFGGGRRE